MAARRYRYSYQTIVRYCANVTRHHFLIRCTPRNDGYQHIVEQSVHLLTPTYMVEAKDCFGNDIRYGSMMEGHDIFVVASSGVVECCGYRVEDHNPDIIFLTPTPVTTCDEQMVRLEESVDIGDSDLAGAIALSEAIYKRMRYEAGVTDCETSASRSFSLGVGVCQDYAHILIAMCRQRAIAARYVVGFVVGTGETHAWVEVYHNGVWYGVDPTHNKFIVNDYIKIAHGRDALDCSVIRGVHVGNATQMTEVKVVLERIE